MLNNMISFITPVGISLLLGVIIALVHMYRNTYSRSFAATLAVLPAIVCTVIMAVNGNLGAGVAVAGAFSLVRFRSAPGTAREVTTLFMAMATGLLTGMGYNLYAALFVLVIGLALILCQILGFGNRDSDELRRSLRITIPEDLDYTGVFDDIFDNYTTEHKLISSGTTNMGSMFKLRYDIRLRDADMEKDFIDKLRCRNGNLEISMSVIRNDDTDRL